MHKEKKRLSKKAKADLKILKESKLLAAKNEREAQSDSEFRSSVVTPRIATANKLRPEKKRG